MRIGFTGKTETMTDADYWHSYDDAVRIPKEIYAVILKGRDPQTNKAKTWVRIHTSKTAAKKAAAAWDKYKFGEIRIVKTTTQWEDI